MEIIQPANSQPIAAPEALLQLLHLADSALPIGATAHSFGVETLIAECSLGADDLTEFFEEWLRGQGHAEAAFCHMAHGVRDEEEWLGLNASISSYKPARESRDASLRLGKRFMALAKRLIDDPFMPHQHLSDAHLSAAFGRVGAVLRIEPSMVAAAYLHQTIYGAISACQRLLPLGQTAAMKLLWSLKPSIHRVVEHAHHNSIEELWNVQPMLEIASMRHPQLTTRLFIS